MRLRQSLRPALVAVGLVALLVAPAGAERFFEGQIWGEEFEDGPAQLRQFEIFQTIHDQRFGASQEVFLILQIELGNLPADFSGVVRLRAKVFKADGSSIKLPPIRASLQDTGVALQRSTRVSLGRGDIIRWRLRFRGVPEVAQDGACTIIVGVANQEL